MKAFFFGSFDPPHIGHVSLVTSALNSRLVTEVEVVPAFKSVWKNTETSFDLRYCMCEIAFGGICNVRINNIEEKLSGGFPLPTYKVIDYLYDKESSDFYILTSIETWREIPNWVEGDRIIKENKFIVACPEHLVGNTSIGFLGTSVCSTMHVPDIKINSTTIRTMIKNHDIIYPYVNKEIEKLIYKYNLYE